MGSVVHAKGSEGLRYQQAATGVVAANTAWVTVGADKGSARMPLSRTILCGLGRARDQYRIVCVRRGSCREPVQTYSANLRALFHARKSDVGIS